MINKLVQTYINFAIKSGKIIYGADDIIKSKKNRGIILYKETISEKSLNVIKAKKDVEMIIATEELESIPALAGAKVVFIIDENLSKAILKTK
jgi:hypothetical protein